jgi:hypothetical protein
MAPLPRRGIDTRNLLLRIAFLSATRRPNYGPHDRAPLRCPGKGETGMSLFDDVIRICDRGVVDAAWMDRHVQPGGAWSPLGAPGLDVFNKAPGEPMTIVAERPDA